MNEIQIRLKDKSYRILIQPGSLGQIGPLLSEMATGKDVFVISDQNVAPLYGQAVLQSIKSAGFRADIHAVPSGEVSKSLDTANALYTKLIEFQMKRDGWIVALGGGVVGDLAGFVASTYLRGITFVQIPTTLLAQVDSSIGGKVGINHPFGKNVIGSFYQPRFVLMDPETLNTLDKREIWSGMAEVVKYGLIADSELFHWIEKNLNAIVNLSDDHLLIHLLSRCCRIKADVVEKDETENYFRRILNFGHTLGHAVEALGGFQYFKHGEAIVIGMRWATWLSHQKGYLTERQSSQIHALLERFPIPPILKQIRPEKLIEKIQMDKKQTADGIYLVLLENIGKAKIEKMILESWMIEKWWKHVQS